MAQRFKELMCRLLGHASKEVSSSKGMFMGVIPATFTDYRCSRCGHSHSVISGEVRVQMPPNEAAQLLASSQEETIH